MTKEKDKSLSPQKLEQIEQAGANIIALCESVEKLSDKYFDSSDQAKLIWNAARSAKFHAEALLSVGAVSND